MKFFALSLLFTNLITHTTPVKLQLTSQMNARYGMDDLVADLEAEA